MDKIEKVIEALTTQAALQSENIDKLTDNMIILVQAVQMRPTRKETFGVVGRMVSALLVLALGMFIYLAITGQDTRNAAKAIKDCTTPQHACYERGEQRTAQAIVLLSYRGELERIKTELPVARDKQDDIRVGELTKRQDELQKLIAAQP